MTAERRRRGWCVRAGMLFLAANVGWATDFYVATNGSHTAPYTSWGTAATNVKTAVDRANASNNLSTVWISNGWYTVGNMMVVSNAIVRGFGGDRTAVVIDGGGSVRPFLLNHTNSVLRDLTLTNGLGGDAGWAGNGGGVYLNANNALLSNCVVIACTATNSGGGIYLNKGLVRGCLIAGNTAQGKVLGAAGGVAVAADMRVVECVISNNTSLTSGTAVGGVYLSTRSSLYNCEVVGNSGIGGGGVYSRYGDLVTHCVIRGNIGSNTLTSSSGITAGGMIVVQSNQVIRNCLFIDNKAYSGYRGAGGIVGGVTPLMVESCTVASNIFVKLTGVQTGAGGVYDGAVDNYWTNCIVYYNRSESGAIYDSFYFVTAANTNRIVNSCVERPQFVLPVSNGNITNNPLFRAAAQGDYRLATGSPGLNAGANQTWMTNALDLDGNPRLDIRDGKVDMGCYEQVLFRKGTLFLVR